MTEERYVKVKALLRRRAETKCGAAERDRLRAEAIELGLPLTDNVARRFRGRGEAHDDLVQVARVGLIEAVDRFDPAAGSDFLSFAVPTVLGEVRRYFRDRVPSIRIPRPSRELNDLALRVREEFGHREGRDPTVAEIARELDAPEPRVRRALDDCAAGSAVSLDQRRDEDGAGSLADRIGSPERGYARVDDVAALSPAVRSLPDRERRIVGLRFFGQRTQSEIAEQLGISQMHVSRLLRRSLKQLRESLDVSAAAVPAEV